MNDPGSEELEASLAKPDLHQQWKETYITARDERFYEQVFDYITRVLNAPESSTFLDAGCGTGHNAVRLLNRGFRVRAVDFSESVLEVAREEVKAKGLEAKISVQREDIVSLSFEDETFNYVLCWGVLMHIPNLDTAVKELARVLKPAGMLVLGENNMYSLQSLLLHPLKRLLGKEKAELKKTPAGTQYWTNTSAGKLMARETNMQWLIKRFEREGLALEKRVARHFTELHARVSSPLLKALVYAFNNFWFKYIKIPHPAFGNLLIFQKKA